MIVRKDGDEDGTIRCRFAAGVDAEDLLRAIGELCGTSEETAKNSLFRATKKLRLELIDLV